ncbi:MAG: GNAT family N-acetyltransferase [Clostridiales bacterium]|jgi:GNAT superfamily N-acetyltransferase|nr:GNAT family N-acetyltransferase [Clostridiales bacterium]
MEFAIHKVLHGDVHEYVVCHIASKQAALRGIVPDDILDDLSNTVEERVESIKTGLNEARWHYYYAAFDNKMIGRLIFGENDDETQPKTGLIASIYLLPEFWGRGLGRKMMDFAVEKLKSMGFRKVILWVIRENARARRFYESYGFAHDGAEKEDIQGEKLLIHMRYSLNYKN